MKSSVTNSFRKQLEQLPKSIQEQADKAYALWQTAPYHNSLQKALNLQDSKNSKSLQQDSLL
jgi:hypothetical protein